MSHIEPIPARITAWDRVAIVALGGAGCALSYDALQQMATAIHIRGLLTFVFPLVIDGFIAYGVRGLLVLREAPLTARCYVWMLFGTATAASIWANALHAVRLNQQRPEREGLRLGDVTVGILSTLAPLALAGAVHLYILIARRVTEPAFHGCPESLDVPSDRVTDDRAGRLPQEDGHRSVPVSPGPAGALPARSDMESTEPEPEHGGRDVDLGDEPVTRTGPVTHLHPARSPAAAPNTVRHTARRKPLASGDRKTAPVTDEELLMIGRQAVTGADALTRKIVGDAIRRHGHGLGNDRLTVLMKRLRAEVEQSPDPRTG